MSNDQKIMDYVVGLEKNLLKVKEENERLKAENVQLLLDNQHSLKNREIDQLKSNLKIAVEALEYVIADKIWPVIEAEKALSKIKDKNEKE